MRVNILVLYLFLIILLKYSWCEICIQESTCLCRFRNGSSIDLTSLGYPDKPRWESIPPKRVDNYTYSYNPCFSFKLGQPTQECGKGVSVCQVDKHMKLYYDCGDPDTATFSVNSTTGNLQLIYKSTERSTTVILVCSRDAIEPNLTVEGEVSVGHYSMTLTSKCACPGMCHHYESHLSAGSVLVIIFMIFVALYLVLGIIHSSLTRGAHGWELIPHYEFWADFPLLVRDGCVFVVSGCKTETAYERI